jgi:hypothetical protein
MDKAGRLAHQSTLSNEPTPMDIGTVEVKEKKERKRPDPTPLTEEQKKWWAEKKCIRCGKDLHAIFRGKSHICPAPLAKYKDKYFDLSGLQAQKTTKVRVVKEEDQSDTTQETREEFLRRMMSEWDSKLSTTVLRIEEVKEEDTVLTVEEKVFLMGL